MTVLYPSILWDLIGNQNLQIHISCISFLTEQGDPNKNDCLLDIFLRKNLH